MIAFTYQFTIVGILFIMGGVRSIRHSDDFSRANDAILGLLFGFRKRRQRDPLSWSGSYRIVGRVLIGIGIALTLLSLA